MCFERKLQHACALHGATPILIFNNWPHQLWTESGPGNNGLPEANQTSVADGVHTHTPHTHTTCIYQTPHTTHTPHAYTTHHTPHTPHTPHTHHTHIPHITHTPHTPHTHQHAYTTHHTHTKSTFPARIAPFSVPLGRMEAVQGLRKARFERETWTYFALLYLHNERGKNQRSAEVNSDRTPLRAYRF